MKTGLKENILKLRNEGKTYDEIKKKLNCSKSTISYYCKSYSLKKVNINDEEVKKYFKNTNSIVMTLKEFNITKNKLSKILGKIKKIKCGYCDKEIEVSIFCSNKYCSNLCRIEYRKKYFKDRKFNYENLIKWRSDKKIKSIEYKGGKCQICGYDKCKSSLAFHHLDPSQKDFNISKLNRSFEKIKSELDKCILVCSNCHGEIHEGLHTNLMHGWSSGEGIALQKQDININGSSPLPCSNGLII